MFVGQNSAEELRPLSPRKGSHAEGVVGGEALSPYSPPEGGERGGEKMDIPRSPNRGLWGFDYLWKVVLFYDLVSIAANDAFS